MSFHFDINLALNAFHFIPPSLHFFCLPTHLIIPLSDQFSPHTFTHYLSLLLCAGWPNLLVEYIGETIQVSFFFTIRTAEVRQKQPQNLRWRINVVLVNKRDSQTKEKTEHSFIVESNIHSILYCWPLSMQFKSTPPPLPPYFSACICAWRNTIDEFADKSYHCIKCNHSRLWTRWALPLFQL